MKKKLNIIQIKGVKGLLLCAFAICCLAAGFIVFPGWLAMISWNYIASFVNNIPSIGILQGVLLWGIIIASYFTFRKEKLVVCLKSQQGLSEDELKTVFADIKKQAQEDKIIQAMIKAREAELKLKDSTTENENSNKKTEIK